MPREIRGTQEADGSLANGSLCVSPRAARARALSPISQPLAQPLRLSLGLGSRPGRRYRDRDHDRDAARRGNTLCLE